MKPTPSLPSFKLFMILLLLPLWGASEDEGPPYGRAPIEGVEEGGYYRAPIAPELQKHCRLGLEDLRLKDPQGEETPYILEEVPSFKPFQEKRVLEILKKESLEKGGSLLELEDPKEGAIPAIALKVDQGPVSRSIRIEGSQDGEDWETLNPSERYHDERYKNAARWFVLRELNLSGHRFYRIKIGAEGRGLDPRILKAKVLEIKKGWESYHPVPLKDFEVIRKEKRTLVQLSFDAPTYRIDGLDPELENTDYFYRKGYLARGDAKDADSLEKLSGFDLTSYGKSQLRFKGYRSDRLVLVLKDGDLPSLDIERIEAYQRKRGILFRTETGSPPQLEFGDQRAEAPRYQLPHFREQMPDSLKKAKVGDVEWKGPPLQEWGRVEKKEKKEDHYRIWTTIGIVTIWLFGVAVLVSIGLLLYRRIL